MSEIFCNNKIEVINSNLTDIIKSFKVTGNDKDKKVVINLFKNFFNFFFNNLEIDESNEYLGVIYTNLLELCVLFQDDLNKIIKTLLDEIESNLFKIDSNLIKKLINSSLLIMYLTNEINQPNQMLSNYITLLNIFLNKIQIEKNKENILIKTYFIGVLSVLSTSTASYNQFFFNQLEMILNYIKIFLTKCVQKTDFNGDESKCTSKNTSMSTLKILKKILFKKPTHENDNENEFSSKELIIISYRKIFCIVKNQIQIYKDDINFDIMFKNIIIYLKDITELTENKHISYYHAYINDLSSSSVSISNLLLDYEKFKQLNFKKKNVGINYLIIKKKCLPSLEPEIDLSFLGDNFKNIKETSISLAKAIKKKTRKTEKQAIRSLKNEAKIIDFQRQKLMQKYSQKRKEDQRLSNQFIEQQNLEYKKLVTSQPKKRLKFKKQRGKLRK